MSLDEIRQRIDAIDTELVRLLDRRAQAGRDVGKAKAALGLPLYQAGREEAVLARLRGLSDGSMPPASIDTIYRTIMRETLALQTAPACAGHQSGAGKRDVAGRVAANAAVLPGVSRMRVIAPELAGTFQPGQFFQIRVEGGADGLFLRRPFAPSAYTDDGFEFTYAVVGAGTRHLAGMVPGAGVRVLGPLGNAFTPAPAGAHAVLLGGGCGAPSLGPLAAACRRNGVTVTGFIGARSVDGLVGRDEFTAGCDAVHLATDDGTCGWKGTGVDAFLSRRDELGPIDRIYAIGPIPMLRAVAALAAREGIPCEVSLEERMACGFGACMGCVVPVRDGNGSVYRRVCHEGPVFDAAALAWDEIGVVRAGAKERTGS
ncbi:MAG: chorismate mutase [Planctomycetaceae bacterium]|nr:chorismate mutase [Planctomycetaceae bacterium]